MSSFFAAEFAGKIIKYRHCSLPVLRISKKGIMNAEYRSEYFQHSALLVRFVILYGTITSYMMKKAV